MALTLTRGRLWSRARSERVAQIYTWLFGMEALIWAIGTASYIAAPRFITKLLGSASHFQTLMLMMLIACFIVMVTRAIWVARAAQYP